jgi:antirestriction protein
MLNKMNCKIVFGSWKAYTENNQRALGSSWLDMDNFDSVEEIKSALINEGFTSAELEETFIQDYEADFDIFKNCDYINIERAFEILEQIDDSDNEAEAIGAYLEEVSDNIEEACDSELYFYKDMTLAEVCEEITRECDNIPDNLENYIDWEAMARDWSFCGGWYESTNGVLEVR